MKTALLPVQIILLLGPFLFAGAARAADKPTDATLEATVRDLEKQIAEVRGLAFKTPVVAKVIARPKDADKHLQGYYCLKDKTLYVYDDLSGAYGTAY